MMKVYVYFDQIKERIETNTRVASDLDSKL